RTDADASLPVLVDVRNRLEFFVAALCPDAPPIVVAEPPAIPHLLARMMKRIPRHLVEHAAHASTDGAKIRLPRRLGEATAGATLELYRLLALQQAFRAVRGTPAFLPEERATRELYLLSEAVAIDRTIV